MKKIYAIDIIREAWEKLKEDFLKHILVTGAVFIVIMFLIPLTGHKGMLAQLTVNVLNFILALFLIGYSLAVFRGQKLSFEGIFSEYVTIGVILNYVLYSLMLSAAVLGVLSLSIFGFASSMGKMLFLLFLVALLYLAIRLMFVAYFILDGDNFIEAIEHSWKLTQPHVLQLILFIILAAVIMLAGIVAFFAGIFVAYPLILFSQTLVYLKLKGEYNEEEI